MEAEAESLGEKVARLSDVHERMMLALAAVATSNKLWSEKLYDAYLALDPLRLEDFPVSARDQFASIQSDFESLRFSSYGYGGILDSATRCRGICLKIVGLIETLSWEAIDALEEANSENERLKHGA